LVRAGSDGDRGVPNDGGSSRETRARSGYKSHGLWSIDRRQRLAVAVDWNRAASVVERMRGLMRSHGKTRSGSLVTSERGSTARSPADVAARRAWLSLLLFPVAFVASFVVGEGLFSLLAPDAEDSPLWSVVAAGVPAMVVFAVPAVLAYGWGHRAIRLGRRDGSSPALVGIVIVLAFAGVNALSLLVGTLVD
jgi:hypothetical protein